MEKMDSTELEWKLHKNFMNLSNGKSFLSIQEFRRHILVLDSHLDETQINSLVNEANIFHDGRIDFVGYKKALYSGKLERKVPTQKEKFKKINAVQNVLPHFVNSLISFDVTEIDELRHTFNILANSSGGITSHHLQKYLHSLGTYLSLFEVEELIRSAEPRPNTPDILFSPVLHFSGFILVMSKEREKEEVVSVEEVLSVFRIMDPTHSGMITGEQFINILRQFGRHLGEGEEEELLRHAITSTATQEKPNENGMELRVEEDSTDHLTHSSTSLVNYEQYVRTIFDSEPS